MTAPLEDGPRAVREPEWLARERQRAQEFIGEVAGLDPGQLAAIRRQLDREMGERGGCTPWWIYQILARCASGRPDEERLHLNLAALLSMDRRGLDSIRKGLPGFSGGFGTTMDALWRATRRSTDTEAQKAASAPARRLRILLDTTSPGELIFRLRQAVRLALSKQVGIDWPLLLVHLRHWNDSSKWVQKDWAREFYSARPPDEDEQTNPEE